MLRFLFFNFSIFFLGCLYSFAQCDTIVDRQMRDECINTRTDAESSDEIPVASDYIKNNYSFAKYQNAYNGALAYKEAMSKISTRLFWALDGDFKNLEELNTKYDAKEIEWSEYSEDWDVLKSSFSQKKTKIDLVKSHAKLYDVSWFFRETTGYNNRLVEKCCLYNNSPTWNNELKSLELGRLVLPLRNKSSVTTKEGLCQAESYYIDFQGEFKREGNRCNIRLWDYSGRSATLKWRKYAGKSNNGQCAEMGSWKEYKTEGDGPYTVNFLMARPMPEIKVFDKDIRKKTKKYAKTISVSAGDGGSVSPTGKSIFDDGEGIDIFATPDEGYQIKEWKGTGESCFQYNTDSFNHMDKGTSQFTVHPTRSCGIFVSFERKSYTITYSVERTGNHYRGTIEGKRFTHTKNMKHGYSAFFYASPDEGYQIKEWSGDCGRFKKTSNPARFKVLKDCSIHVTFEPEPEPEPEPEQFRIITSVIGGNGTITPTTRVDAGDEVTIIATPDEGWQIKGSWDNGCNSDSSPATFEASKNCSIHVTFEPTDVEPHTITTSVVPILGKFNGRITPTFRVNPGNKAVVTASPDPGYAPTYWGGDCDLSFKSDDYIEDGNVVSFVPNTDCEVTVIFAKTSHTITPSVVGSGGQIRPSDEVAARYGSSVRFSATPDLNYKIKSWGGDCGVFSGASASLGKFRGTVLVECQMCSHYFFE